MRQRPTKEGGVEQEHPFAKDIAVQVAAHLEKLAAVYRAAEDEMESGGAPVDRLATVRAVGSILPGLVETFPGEVVTFVRVQFARSSEVAGEVSAWPLDAVVRDALQNGWEMMSDRQGQAVWLAIRSAAQLDRIAFSLDQMLQDQVVDRVAEEVEAARAARSARFAAAGLRQVHVPVPSGAPDSRWKTYGTVNGRDMRAEELVRRAERWALLASVPDDVESFIQQARLLFVFGWERWEFFSLAQQQGLIGLQAALGSAFDAWLELVQPVVTARRNQQTVLLDDVALRRDSLVHHARRNRLRGMRAGSVRIPRAGAGLPKALEEAGLLMAWESSRCNLLVQMRNELIHGQFAMQFLEGWTADALDQICDLINEVWLRLHALEVESRSMNPPSGCGDPASINR